MVTLALLDPLDTKIVLQWWSFEGKTEITVGRSSWNDVVVRDPRISRQHLRLSQLPGLQNRQEWQLINQGKNDVLINGKVAFRDVVPHQAEIQLAPHGPRLRFFLSDQETAAHLIQGNRNPLDGSTMGRRGKTVPPPPMPVPSKFKVVPQAQAAAPSLAQNLEQDFELCAHQDNDPDHLFCQHCGAPITILRSIRQYDLIKVLHQSDDTATFLAWINPDHGNSPAFFASTVVVLKAFDLSSDRSPQNQERIMRQAMVLNRLDHPRIPHFIDFFPEAQHFYLVMEWVAGSSLAELVQQRGTLTPEQVLACGLQLAELLDYLQHQVPPLIHRDIKPANLVVRYRDGRIVLVDFGVVKSMGGLEQTRLALGGYRAPEQLNGQTLPQSDFFGLGATLLYLLTGEEPARVHRYQPNSAKYYLDKIPGIDLPLAEVLGHLLHPNPSDRYPTVQEVYQGLKIAQQSFRSKW